MAVGAVITSPVPTRGGLDGVGNWLGQQLGETVGDGVGGAVELADAANPIPELLDSAMTATIYACALALGGALIVVGTWRAVS